MDHEMLIDDIESRTGHGRKAANSKGKYMGLVAHEEAPKFSQNNQELGGLVQRQRLDTSMCLLVIYCLATLLFGEVDIMHTPSSRCHKKHRGTQMVEFLLQWTQVCIDS